jgi:hypothetical protein
MTAKSRKLLWAAVLLASASAYAAGFSIDVQPTPVPAAAALGRAQITSVSDNRPFQAAPSDPSTPSLQNSAQLQDSLARARALGRERFSYGRAAGNVMLPEGRTVELLVRDAIAKALVLSGYEVVDAGSAQSDSALPLKIDIEQFWAWYTPRPPIAGGGTVEFRAVLVIQGEAITGQKEVIVTAYARGKGIAPAQSMLVSTPDQWRGVLVAGVDDLAKNAIAAMKPAR